MDRHPMTAEMRDRAEEQERELYARLFIRESRRRRAEWLAEFGDKFPVPNSGPAIHQVVTQQMAAMRGANN